jgi:hypothetical protein
VFPCRSAYITLPNSMFSGVMARFIAASELARVMSYHSRSQPSDSNFAMRTASSLPSRSATIGP